MRITDVEATNRVLSVYYSSVDDVNGRIGFPEGPLFDSNRSAYLTMDGRNCLVVRFKTGRLDTADEVNSVACELNTLHTVMTMLEAVNK